MSDSKIDYGLLRDLIGYRIRRAQMTFFTNFSDSCAELGISPGLFAVIEVIYRNGGLTQTAVAQALGTDRSAMVGAVDKLESMGLIERRTSKKDRRSYALYMTRKGDRWYKNAYDKVVAQDRALEERLKPGEKEILVDILSRYDSTEAGTGFKP